jgi:MoaE-MoaD fusion protein
MNDPLAMEFRERDTLVAGWVGMSLMRIRVLFFGVLKDLMGGGGEAVELPEGSSVSDVLAHYEIRVPRLRQSFGAVAVAVNQHYAGPDTKLKADDEVALLPPVSGGAPGDAGEGSASQTQASNLGEPDGEQASEMGRRRAAIVRDSIDTQRVLSGLKRGEDGAAVVFEGVVRNQTRGRTTLYLDYEAYEEMALQQMELLVQQALKQFRIRDVGLVHRLGRLQIGETSVLIAVVSAHRAAAFDACRWLIDTLKRTVPIWKKEYFTDGAVWADGEPFPAEIARANSSVGRGSPASRLASK